MRRWVRRLTGGAVAGLVATVVVAGQPAGAAPPFSFTGEIDDGDPNSYRPAVGNPPTVPGANHRYHYETHTFTPAVTGQHRFVVTGDQGFDTFLCIYAGPFLPALPPGIPTSVLVNVLECQDDVEGTNPVIVRSLVAGQQYTVYVSSGWSTLSPDLAFGSYRLDVTPPPPTVTIQSRTMAEVDTGDGNPGQAVTVSIDSPQAETTHIEIITPPMDGALHGTDSARGGDGFDYTTSVTSVAIPAGETSTTFGVRVFADVVDELDERVTFAAGSVRVGDGPEVESDGSGVVTITDDDEPQGLTVSAATVAEGNAGTTPMAVTVATTGAALHDVYLLVREVSCETGVPATAGTDFTTFPAPPAAGASWIRIPKGQSSATATIAVIGDTAFEPDETVCFRAATAVYLQGPGGDFSTVAPTGLPADAFSRTIARDFTGTITNDDPPPPVTATLAPASISVDEGATATMTVRFTPATALPTTVTWHAVDVTDPKRRATSTDYAAGARTLTVPAGTSSAIVTVATAADNLTETDEAFRVQLVASTTPGMTIGAASTTTVTIRGGQALPPPPVFPPPIFGLFR